MRSGLVILVLLVISSFACGDGRSASPAVPIDTGDIYAAAAFHLATESNTFGPGHRFSELLLVDHTVRDIVATYGSGPRGYPYTESERATIENRLSELSPVRFVESAADWRTEELQPTIPGSAIVTLGPAEVRDDSTAAVGVSLWCSGTCGFWTVFVLEQVDGDWIVTGTEGPSVIS